MIIYVDSEYKCHVTNDGSMMEVEEAFFDGKCDIFIMGYKFVPAGCEYNGEIATGTMIFPWVDYEVLDAAQRGYEESLEAMSDMQAALEVLEVEAE